MTLCKCGCGNEIIIKPWHKYRYIEYIKGHFTKNKYLSEEIKQKMQGTHPNQLGKNNPFFNKHHTEESKQKMKKPKSEEHKQKIKENHADFSGENHPMYGKHHSIETIKKMSEIRIRLGLSKGRNNPMYGKLPFQKMRRYYYDSPLQGVVCLRFSYEFAYAKYLDANKILWMYEMETFDLGDRTYTPDFFLPKFEKFIEVKGYMSDKAQKKIDMFLEQYTWDLEVLRKEDLIKLGIKL